MTLESYRACCLSLRGTTEEFPFGEDTVVFKVMGKMFTLAGMEDFVTINIKVDPETGVEMRERYPAVIPGYHMNKKHWVTLMLDGSLSDKLVKGWIEESYRLVVQSLSKRDRLTLESL